MAIVQFYTTRSKDETPSQITNNLRYELPDDHNFSADDDLESCIEACAEYYHADCDGWESRFPCLFMLWIDDEYLGIFEVKREFEPTFSAQKVE
ncbi:hypothetical protein ABN125_09585 [Proteus terrae]|uniref:Uncharacterized protein n=1 Tax=Proteus columbae TaxID=1987580 RepID=A0A6I7D5Q4_9GAMM|nr:MULTISPECIES: hypothetical protein [Proteus]MBG3020409.1 hypothetical protein [Proteus mirabilis]MBI6340474.1 hypothetical protein [Proteus sp. PR00224]QHN10095.1 hypothetical protein F1325_06320 [Proteus columbae]QKJ47736.1 hypothetical protein G9394_01865 [Proteus vulgaris]GLX62269.1 hypothetical protein KMU_03090 [Proteus vulgaris]